MSIGEWLRLYCYCGPHDVDVRQAAKAGIRLSQRNYYEDRGSGEHFPSSSLEGGKFKNKHTRWIMTMTMMMMIGGLYINRQQAGGGVGGG